MVLAAGIGSRLRPLTENTPKALLKIGDVALLEIIVRRLVKAGADSLIVNTFHLAEQVEAFLKSRDLGAPVAVSREAELLETGGGLKQASWFFDDDRPFFLHNGDVYSEVDLARMYRSHIDSGALATLAVSERPTERHLLFDLSGRLCGRQSLQDGRQWAAQPVAHARPLAFNGIAVLNPAILARMTENGVFSILKTYLRLAGAGASILSFRSDEYYCRDIGTAAKLAEVRSRAQAQGLRV